MRKHPVLGDIRPYNFISPQGRQVTAWMSVERDHRLGALLIEAVDGEANEQFVYGIPKIHYPYRRGLRHPQDPLPLPARQGD